MDALGPDAARLVGMDGFHLAQAELERLGRADRKGAPDTFDAAGFVALLRRLRAREDAVVYAPEFHREIEQPVACAVPVPREMPLVVTEGNYLLVADGDWAGVRALLDEAWFVEGDEDRRRELADRPPRRVRQVTRRSHASGSCAATSATPSSSPPPVPAPTWSCGSISGSMAADGWAGHRTLMRPCIQGWMAQMKCRVVPAGAVTSKLTLACGATKVESPAWS